MLEGNNTNNDTQTKSTKENSSLEKSITVEKIQSKKNRNNEKQKVLLKAFETIGVQPATPAPTRFSFPIAPNDTYIAALKAELNELKKKIQAVKKSLSDSETFHELDDEFSSSPTSILHADYIKKIEAESNLIKQADILKQEIKKHAANFALSLPKNENTEKAFIDSAYIKKLEDIKIEKEITFLKKEFEKIGKKPKTQPAATSWFTKVNTGENYLKSLKKELENEKNKIILQACKLKHVQLNNEFSTLNKTPKTKPPKDFLFRNYYTPEYIKALEEELTSLKKTPIENKKQEQQKESEAAWNAFQKKLRDYKSECETNLKRNALAINKQEKAGYETLAAYAEENLPKTPDPLNTLYSKKAQSSLSEEELNIQCEKETENYNTAVCTQSIFQNPITNYYLNQCKKNNQNEIKKPKATWSVQEFEKIITRHTKLNSSV